MIANEKNSGYGISMNQGFDMAGGEYIGILESDDFAEPTMYEKLYAAAHENSLDMVKSSFWFYYSVPKAYNEKYEVASKGTEKRTFCPAWDFDAPMEMVEFFNLSLIHI